MSGKRKRGNDSLVGDSAETPVPPAKPISAIAAARLQLEAKLQSQNIVTSDDVQDSRTSPIVESISDLSESELEEEPRTLLVRQNFKLCTWRRIPENIISDTPSELTVIIEKHQTISFIGCFDLKVLKGAVNVNGANIGAIPRPGDTAKSFRAYVPSTHPITKIRGLDRTSHVQIASCEEPTLFEAIGPLFAGIWSAKREKGRSFDYIQESDADPLKRALTPESAPEDWIRTIEDISSTCSITLVIGPPLTGKSTFAKRLLNRYLTGFGKTAKAVSSLCYLDLDANKPEYTPHGQLSLVHVREINLGPSFTHPIPVPGSYDQNEIVAAHTHPIRGLSNYEEYFMSCVTDLVQTYQDMRSKNTNLPLIINTPSQFYTTHFPLLESLLSILKPNNIVHLGNTSSIDTDTAEKLHFLSTHSAKQSSTLYELSAQQPVLPASRTEADLRAMHMQSYFHLTVPTANSKLPSWNPQPLSTSLTPWQFSYEETPTRTQDFQGFLYFNDPPSPSQLVPTLNGSIIHIISITNPSSLLETPQDQQQQQQNDTPLPLPRTPKHRIPYFPTSRTTHLPPTPTPSTTRLLSTALIHSFDPRNQLVNILVPNTHDALIEAIDPRTTILVGGCCDLPEWAYIEDAQKAYEVQKRRLEGVLGGENVREEDVMEELMMSSMMMGTGSTGMFGPWVERKSVVDGMGYFGTVRRVRKFLG